MGVKNKRSFKEKTKMKKANKTKRRFLLTLCLFLGIATFTLSSCGIISKLENAVVYPESYSITYEITSKSGVVTTITKTVDALGNVYVCSSEEEKLFINDNGVYTLYRKSESGIFEEQTTERYTKNKVEELTAEIKTYAEESKKQFMPTAKKENQSEVLSRTCDVYKLGVGTQNNSAFYYYYVDVQTGICLQLEVKHTALGQEVAHNTETYVCVEFITENVQDLQGLLN